MSESPNDSGESPSYGNYDKYSHKPNNTNRPSNGYNNSSGESPDGESPSSNNNSRRKYR